MDVLSVLVEIRDLLQLRKNPQKKRVKAKLKTRPAWQPSPYPIERWNVGTSKAYPPAEKHKILMRISHVNGRMKHLGLPNHFRHRTVLRRAQLYLEVWRDK